jgi:cytochrome c-type biogenesis protein CcmH
MMLLLLLLASPLARAQAPEAPVPVTPPAADAAPVADPAAAPETAGSVADQAAAQAAGVDPSAIIGPPAGPPLEGEALREKTREVASLLRCPVCQGLSVWDSPSESALAMKAEVQDLLAKGYDTDQILLYFETSYGEFIRLEPKAEGINLIVWTAPGLLVLGGLAMVLWVAAARGRPAPAVAPAVAAAAGAPAAGAPRRPTAPTLATTPIDPELLPYLEQVRRETR